MELGVGGVRSTRRRVDEPVDGENSSLPFVASSAPYFNIWQYNHPLSDIIFRGIIIDVKFEFHRRIRLTAIGLNF